MASTNCPGCGEARPDPEVPCPRCGYKKDPAFFNKLAKFSVLFAILGVLWLLFLTKGMWSN